MIAARGGALSLSNGDAVARSAGPVRRRDKGPPTVGVGPIVGAQDNCRGRKWGEQPRPHCCYAAHWCWSRRPNSVLADEFGNSNSCRWVDVIYDCLDASRLAAIVNLIQVPLLLRSQAAMPRATASAV